MAAGPVCLLMRPARCCPHGFPLLMHIGLSKLIGINGENAPLASRLTEAQFRVWGFRWLLPRTGFVSTFPIKKIWAAEAVAMNIHARVRDGIP